MKIEEFITQLKKCKQGSAITQTGKGIQCIVSHDRKRWIITEHKTCPHCHANQDSKVTILFNIPMGHLSIFQAEILHSIYAKKTKPYDYAQYHECPAGKELIQNINTVKNE